MNTLEKGKDKINQICDLLRKDTLDPAKREAEQIIADANKERDKILSETNNEAARILEDARRTIEKDKRVCLTALEQAGKQALEALKQLVQEKLFNEEIESIISSQAKDPQIVARLINAIVEGIEKEGISADLLAYVPQHISVEEVNKHLMNNVISKLKEGNIEVGSFKAGAKVEIKDKQLTIDISAEALRDFLNSYLREDFRRFLFRG